MRFTSTLCSKILLAALAAALSISASGCQHSEAEPNAPRIAALEKENKETRDKLESLTSDHIAAETLLNEISGALADAAGKEQEIQKQQAEFDSAQWEEQIDRKQRMFSDLDSMKSRLADAERKSTGLLLAIKNNSNLALYEKTIVSLNKLLNAKEEELSTLRSEVADLQSEVDAGQHSIQALENQKHESDSKVAAQESIIGELRESDNNYYLIATSDDINFSLRHGDIARTLWTYRISESALISGQVPSAFHAIDSKATEIALGDKNTKPKILSAHWKYPSLYSIEYKGNYCLLLIRSPAFWRIARYLIVKIER
jgi:septal ring factor EnvC (AmiA/AmiB activator)